MKSIRFFTVLTLLALFCLAAPSAASAWGEIREATVNLNVRKAPNKNGKHVVTLAKGQRVKVDFIKDGWAAVFNLTEKTRDKKKAVGYANVKYLMLIKKAPNTASAPKAQPKAVVQAEAGQGEVKAGVADRPVQDPLKVGVDPSRVPVKITSDRMTYDETGKIVSFQGNVVAEHGELTLWSDTLSAFLASKDSKKFAADSVDRIVAEGNVRAKKGNSTGSCGKLTYFVEDQVLVMERNPLLKDGPNSLTGEKIKFFVKDNRSEVIGGSKRVKAIFMTPGDLKVQ